MEEDAERRAQSIGAARARNARGGGEARTWIVTGASKPPQPVDGAGRWRESRIAKRSRFVGCGPRLEVASLSPINALGGKSVRGWQGGCRGNDGARCANCGPGQAISA